MAQRLGKGFYQIDPAETLTFLIEGPDDPIVALSGAVLPVQEGSPFDVTPRMLNGEGAHHQMRIALPFPDGEGSYKITISAGGSVLDTIPRTMPDDPDDNLARVVLDIQVGS